MTLKKQIKKELSEQGGKVAKAMMVQFFIYITIILQIGVVILSINGSFFPGGDAMTDIVGTCGDIQSFIYRLFCNEFVIFLGMSIIMILYYSVSVIEPNSLEKEAAKLKKKISRSHGKEGDVIAFVAMYDRIII